MLWLVTPFSHRLPNLLMTHAGKFNHVYLINHSLPYATNNEQIFVNHKWQFINCLWFTYLVGAYCTFNLMFIFGSLLRILLLCCSNVFLLYFSICSFYAIMRLWKARYIQNTRRNWTQKGNKQKEMNETVYCYCLLLDQIYSWTSFVAPHVRLVCIIPGTYTLHRLLEFMHITTLQYNVLRSDLFLKFIHLYCVFLLRISIR